MRIQKIVFNFGETSCQSPNAREMDFASISDFLFRLHHRASICATVRVVPSGVFHPQLPDFYPGKSWVLYDALRRIMTTAQSGGSILGTVELRAKLPNSHGIQSGYLVSSLEWFVLPEENTGASFLYIRVRHSDPDGPKKGYDVSALKWGSVYVGPEAPIIMSHGALFPEIKRQKSYTLGALWEQGLATPLLPLMLRVTHCTTLYSIGNILLVNGGTGAPLGRPTYLLTPEGPQEVSLQKIRQKLDNIGGLALTPKVLLLALAEGLPTENTVADNASKFSKGPNPGALYRRVASALIDKAAREHNLRFLENGHVVWDSWTKIERKPHE